MLMALCWPCWETGDCDSVGLCCQQTVGEFLLKTPRWWMLLQTIYVMFRRGDDKIPRFDAVRADEMPNRDNVALGA